MLMEEIKKKIRPELQWRWIQTNT